MTNTNKIIATIVIVAVLLIGVGYAIIENITLEISGIATAAAVQGNFNVVLTGNPKVSSTDIVTKAEVAKDGKSAEFTIANVSAKDDTATMTYTVINNSSDLTAVLTAATSNTNTEYFSVDYEFDEEKGSTLKAGESTTVTITVTVIKTPVDGPESATIGLNISAQPQNPTTQSQQPAA